MIAEIADGVSRGPGPRAVEVDDVEPARPGRRERPRDRGRIVGERRLAREVALLEADHAAAAKVDRRQDLEVACHPPSHHVSVLARYYDSTLEQPQLGRRTTMATDWRTPDAQALFEAIRRPRDLEETERFFRDLCTLNELRDMAQRWAVVRRLDAGQHYAEISRDTGREHRHHHPDRLVAPPRRGRLPVGPRSPGRGLPRGSTPYPTGTER